MAGIKTMPELFEAELRDMYDAEKQILKALPKMVKAATDKDLSQGLASHLEETKGHVARLEQVFESCDLKARGKACKGMKGVLEEGAEMLDEVKVESVLDAAIISAGQRVEHYEITGYGTLIAFAKLLGHDEAATLLEANLKEEKAADVKLNKLAESKINRMALESSTVEEEEEEEVVA